MASALTKNEVVALAKTHLRLPTYANNALIPQCYLAELEEHVRFYPLDTNFHIVLQPGVGHGVVYCREVGCEGQPIVLGARKNTTDGGKRDGLGTLATYRGHVNEHPTHKKQRHARVKREYAGAAGTRNASGAATDSSTGLKKANSLVSRLDTNLSTAPHTPSPPVPRPPAPTSAPRSLQVPPKAMVPKKRLSDPFPVKLEDEDGSVAPPSPPKRAKIEAPGAPLGILDSNSALAPRSPVTTTHSSADSTRVSLQRITEQVQDVSFKINSLKGKQKKSPRDYQKLAQHKDRLKELHAASARLAAVPQALTQAVPYNPQDAFVKVEHLGLKAVAPLHEVRPEAQRVASGSNIQLTAQRDDDMVGEAARNHQFDAFDPYLGRLSPLNVKAEGSGSTSVPPTRLPPHSAVWMDTDPDGSDEEEADRINRAADILTRVQAAVASPEELSKFLMNAGNSEQFDGNASVDKALEKLGLPSLNTTLDGMTVTLLPHQVIGVAWMQEQERSIHRGGIMADEMGLGKTIQMIAVMVSNQSDDPLCKTTLIIAPVALLDQWQSEIETKSDLGFKCLIYHGSNKPKSIAQLRKHDVVLTSFHTLALEWPDAEKEMKEAMKRPRTKKKNSDFVVDDSDSDVPAPKRKPRKNPGLLLQMKWHRIVLDEAQNIRNRQSRISRAMCAIDAEFRWCLTGTPIVNSLADAYSYMRFTRIRPWYDWTEFHSHVSCLERKNPTLASNRLQVIFVACMLRRKKDSELDGKRLVELPSKTVEMVKLTFSKEEQEIYNMVEKKTQAVMNRFLRQGTVLKNYVQVLVMLLRLRQICSHPSLILEEVNAYIEPGEEVDDSTPTASRSILIRAEKLISSDFVKKMKYKLKQKALARMEAEKLSADATVEDEECPICFDQFTDAVITPCTHAFCSTCIEAVFSGPRREDGDEPTRFKGDERPCPSCRSVIHPDKVFPRAAFEPTDAELAAEEAKAGGEDAAEEKAVEDQLDSDSEMPDVKDIVASDAKGKSKAKGKGRANAKGKGKAKAKKPVRRVMDSDEEEESGDDDDEYDSDISDFIVQSDEDEEEKDERRALRKRLGKKTMVVEDSDDEGFDPAEESVIYGKRSKAAKSLVGDDLMALVPKFLPSTKMKYMMETLKTWAKENPGEKTMLVSQWTSCLELVSDYLKEEAILHVKYQGDMKRPQRDQAVRTFMENDKVQVMLMSLKCGGVGLNLTRANRVISLDLGWSEAVESQAFDRVHRLGQTRPVVVQRVVIKDSVEDRVLALQERKRNLAEGSLGEGGGKKIGRLSVKELANLFGLDVRGRLLQ